MLCKVLSIDAWRDGDHGWFWNQWFSAGKFNLEEGETNRSILRKMRDGGWLADASKGKVAVEDDQYNLVIVAKGTREPLFAIEYGNHY